MVIFTLSADRGIACNGVSYTLGDIGLVDSDRRTANAIVNDNDGSLLEGSNTGDSTGDGSAGDGDMTVGRNGVAAADRARRAVNGGILGNGQRGIDVNIVVRIELNGLVCRAGQL